MTATSTAQKKEATTASPVSPKTMKHAADEPRGRQLDGRVERADPGAARAAAAAQREPRDHRHVVVPGQLRAAAHAGRARLDDRAALRDARGDDVHEASERERGPEREHSESDVHVRLIGSPAAGVEAGYCRTLLRNTMSSISS